MGKHLQEAAAANAYQPLDADLTSIAGISQTSGLLRKTAQNAWELDTNSYLTANQSISISGDISGTGTTAIAATLATVNSNVGSFGSATATPVLTVNAKGLVTAVSTSTITPAWSSITSKPTTLSGFGITDAFSSTGSFYLGTTSVPINRSSGSLSLADVSIDGSAGSVPWSGVSSKPTTVAGFGITDAAPLASPTFTGTLSITGSLDITSTSTKNIRTKNSTSFVTSKADGTDQEWMWPCWSDNKMYTNYGPSGWVIRNSSSTAMVTADNAGLFTFSGGLTVTGTTTLTQPAIDNPRLGYDTAATAAGTTTLTATSGMQQFFTGTTTQTVVLPVTSTLALGQRYEITNNAVTNANTASSSITVKSSGANDITVIPPGCTATLTCILTSGTTAASWDAHMSMPLVPALESKNANYTVALGDSGKIIEFSAAATITLDANPPMGFQVTAIRTGTGTVTFQGSGVTVNATPGLTLRTQWSSATAIKRSGNFWVVIGDLIA